MSLVLKIFLLVAEILYFGVLLHFMKKKMMMIRYSLIWIVLGVCMLVFTLFPNLMISFVKAIGVEYQMNGLFGIFIFFLLLMLLSMTAIVSGQTDSIRKLTQENALLEERLRKLEEAKTNSLDKEAGDVNV